MLREELLGARSVSEYSKNYYNAVGTAHQDHQEIISLYAIAIFLKTIVQCNF